MKNLHKIFFSVPLPVDSEEAMRALGRDIAAELEAGDVLGLVGDLGAGKTRLVQGILEGLGAGESALSPTFSIVHEHSAARIPTAHFDLYRLCSPDEALGFGWDEFLASPSILLVEWADKFDGALMPPDTIWINIRSTGPSSREVYCVLP